MIMGGPCSCASLCALLDDTILSATFEEVKISRVSRTHADAIAAKLI